MRHAAVARLLTTIGSAASERSLSADAEIAIAPEWNPDDKRAARLNLIKDLLNRLHYGDKDIAVLVADPTIVFQYDRACVENSAISP